MCRYQHYVERKRWKHRHEWKLAVVYRQLRRHKCRYRQQCKCEPDNNDYILYKIRKQLWQLTLCKLYSNSKRYIIACYTGKCYQHYIVCRPEQHIEFNGRHTGYRR